MLDKLTSDEVRKSVARHRIRSLQRMEVLAVTARLEVGHRDYSEAVRSGELAPWERAHAHVVIVSDFLRACDGRLPDGRPRVGAIDARPDIGPVVDAPLPPAKRYPAVGEAPAPELGFDEADRYRAAVAEEDLGYVHDPGWRNGGIGAVGGEDTPDDIRKENGLPPSPNVRGLDAFALVHRVENGIPELAWYRSASALELGVSSSFDAMVTRLLRMNASSSITARASEGPTEDQIHAATLQRTVRQRLAKLADRHQAVLELAYTDRTYDAHLVAIYGEGLAPIVWLAASHVGGVSKEGRVTVTAAALKLLTAAARQDWPTYEDSAEGGNEELVDRVKRVASLLLWTAHEHYRIAAGMNPSIPPPRRKRRRLPVLVELPTSHGLRPAPTHGNVGTPRRSIVEVPRAEVRAA